MSAIVPWIVGWSGEEHFELRPCRWVEGRVALWMPHLPNTGRPNFAKPHTVRQRRAMAERRCSVCGEPAPIDDLWWFRKGRVEGRMFTTTEPPLHRHCAEQALQLCPNLKGRGDALEPMPPGMITLMTLIGGPAVERDFGLRIDPTRQVVGSIKLAWSLATPGLPNWIST